MTLDSGKCLFYKHRSPWEVAANAGGALTAKSGKHWPALAGTVGPCWMDAQPLTRQALGNFWLLPFYNKPCSLSEWGTSLQGGAGE